MAEIVGVRFKGAGKVYYFDPDDKPFSKGESVIVETARGIECGEVAMENREVPEDQIVKPLKMIIRTATPEDLKIVAENRAKEKDAFQICLQKIAAHKLEMKLVEVEYTSTEAKSCFTLQRMGALISANWSRISPAFSARASSSGRLACAMNQSC